MTNCFFCRKKFNDLDGAHLHAFGLTSNAIPSCQKMSLKIIVEIDSNNRWFA